MREEFITLSKIDTNTGQLAGVPANPRMGGKKALQQMVRSLTENPEMLCVRGLVVVENGNRYVAVCGNLRLRALREMKATDVPCVVLPENYDRAAIRRIAIADNEHAGDWDYMALMADFDVEALQGYGVNFDGYLQHEQRTEGAGELDVSAWDESMVLRLEYTPEDAAFVRSELAKYGSTPEVAVLALIRKEATK